MITVIKDYADSRVIMHRLYTGIYIYIYIHIHTCREISLHTYLSIYLSIYRHIYRSFYLAIDLSFYIYIIYKYSFYLSIYFFICLYFSYEHECDYSSSVGPFSDRERCLSGIKFPLQLYVVVTLRLSCRHGSYPKPLSEKHPYSRHSQQAEAA